MHVTIFPNHYRTPCQTYICRNMSSWFIGVDGGPLNTAYTLCDSCTKHMLENLPIDLMPDGPQKDMKVKEQAKEAVLAAAKEALVEQLRAIPPVVVEEPEEEVQEIIEALRMQRLKVANEPAEPTAVEKLEAKTTYRCLECGAEFADKRGLSNHMRGKHKEE